MQVISGPMGQPKLHFEAPSADRLPAEMALRDVNELMTRGVLRKMAGGGRSTGYELNEPEA